MRNRSKIDKFEDSSIDPHQLSSKQYLNIKIIAMIHTIAKRVIAFMMKNNMLHSKSRHQIYVIAHFMNIIA